MTFLVRRFAAFADLPAAYDELFASDASRLQYDQTRPWLEVLWRHACDAGERLELIGVEDAAGRAVALLPLRRRASRFPAPRRLGALANYYASLFGPALDARANAEGELWRELARGIKAAGWDVLELQPLSAEHAVHVSDALRAEGVITQTYFRFGNWYLEVAGRSFDEYFKALPSQLRNTVTRREKKLRAAGRVVIEIERDPQSVARALEAYQHIYASSWKQPEPYPAFVPSMVRAMAERDWLRLGVVWLDTTPLAAQIWFIKDRVASIFKLAYDERFKEFSAGSILTTTLMRHAIDDEHVAIVDYLTGDDAYKRDWMSHRRERMGVMAFNPHSLRGLALAARHVAFDKLRRRFRRAPVA